MPAQKRSASEALLHNHEAHDEEEEEEKEEPKGNDDDDDDAKEDEAGDEQHSKGSSSNSTSSSSSEEDEQQPEFVYVELSEIRKDVQCPICLGIIKKTRTVMECLHRFCRECIDKSMRLGNNECPACRTHCASRRSLRDDPNYDALIAALYPDIEKYEEEELAFHEEERNRNKQIQASIAQVLQKQSEARRNLGKDTSGVFSPRPLRNLRNSRRRRGSRGTEVHALEDNEDENNGGKESSSDDEHCTDVKPRRYKRRSRLRSSQPSSSAVKSEGVCSGNDSEIKRESRGISPSLVWSPEMLAWGGGGARSHTRHGYNSGGNSKSFRSSRISKMVDHFKSLNDSSDEVHVKVLLVSVNEQIMPSLGQPYIYCKEKLSVKHLCDYVSCNISMQPEEVEILVVKNTTPCSTLEDELKSLPIFDPCKSELLTLEEQETLAGIRATCISSGDHLILAYRRKETAP